MSTLYKYLFFLSITLLITLVIWMFSTSFYQLFFLNLLLSLLGICIASIEGLLLQNQQTNFSKTTQYLILLYCIGTLYFILQPSLLFEAANFHLIVHLFLAPLAFTQLIASNNKTFQRYPLIGLAFSLTLVLLTVFFKLNDYTVIFLFLFAGFIVINLFRKAKTN